MSYYDATAISAIDGYFGRRRLSSAYTQIDESNLIEVLNSVLSDHFLNSAEINYLWYYWRGAQPILLREKTVRTEINNKIVENHAQETVSFFSGYFLGEPIAYVRRGEADTATEIDKLNVYMQSVSKAALDKELATWMFIGGVGYRICLPAPRGSEEPFIMDVLDPRDNFVVYTTDVGRKPLMGVMLKVTPKKKIIYAVYTDTHYYEVETGQTWPTNTASNITPTPMKITKSEPHMLGVVPIIEYQANAAAMGAFEPGMGILDAINTTTSNRIDGIEQFIQAVMVLTDADMDEEALAQMKEWGLLKLTSSAEKTPTLKFLSQELNQVGVQTLIDYMKETYYQVVGMPHSAKGLGGGSSGNVGSVIMWQGWETCEARVKDTERLFDSPERKFLRLVLKILDVKEQLKLSESSIEIKFTRRQYDAIITKVQALQGMLQAHLAPEVAIATCGLFNDPVDVTSKSKPFLKFWDAPAPALAPPTEENPDEANT